MDLRRILPVMLLAAFLVGCGGGDPVQVSGDGWTAEFPGEVEESSDPVPVPGLDQPVSADSTVWESRSEALTVTTTDFPQEIIDLVDAQTLLMGSATGGGGVIVEDSSLLDGDGTFRGRDAVVYTLPQGDLTTTGLAFLDGVRLYQILHVTRGDDASALDDLVQSFSFAG